jgi:hypothetical protein
MKNRSLIFFLSAILITTLSGPAAYAAETPAVQRALENVKESLDTLIATKDDKKVDDVSFRIDTYRKVLVFAIAETKDLKVRLLALEGLEKDGLSDAWRKGALAKLTAALDRYAAEQKFLDENEETINVARIKSIADAFKEWRDGEYAEVASQVREMLLIDQQSKTLETAGRRYQKVEEDVAKIKKARLKGYEDLITLMGKVESALKDAKRLDAEALLLFQDSHFPVLDTGTSTATSTASSTPSSEDAQATEPTVPEQASTTTSTPSMIRGVLTASSSASSTQTNTTSTASSSAQLPPPSLPPSVKDLVKQSLVKTKEAYKVFIEMSNFVRELLK